MKIKRKQIETALVEKIDKTAAETAALLVDVPKHKRDRMNPHGVTAKQAGTYTQKEIDEKNDAVANNTYGKAYWYGRKYAATPWPLPADGEMWEGGARDGFDFSSNTPWEWNGSAWAPGEPVTNLINGTTVGASGSFLDIPDSGYPGLARYSMGTDSWDFYPNKYEAPDLSVFKKLAGGEFSIKDRGILYRHLADAGILTAGYISMDFALTREDMENPPYLKGVSMVDIGGDMCVWVPGNDTELVPENCLPEYSKDSICYVYAVRSEPEVTVEYRGALWPTFSLRFLYADDAPAAPEWNYEYNGWYYPGDTSKRAVLRCRYSGQNTDGFYSSAILDASTSHEASLARWPLHSIYMTTEQTPDNVPINPDVRFGGTWVRVGEGRVPVGVGTGTDTVKTLKTFGIGEVGGKYLHVLTNDEMPSHSHAYANFGGFGDVGTDRDSNWNDTVFNPLVHWGGNRTTDPKGGSKSHNNIQPYFTCYFWERTA